MAAIQRFDTGKRLSEMVVYNGTVWGTAARHWIRKRTCTTQGDPVLFSFALQAYLAGQVPEKTLDAGITEQAAEVLHLIDGLLERAGTSKEKILSVQAWFGPSTLRPSALTGPVLIAC
jgi:hypothetical protein